ncbi:hypothetical protein DJ568_01660 [Mucilaginibacter hurinus]|uniref:Uncharacterized protein n=1 Tax=Mucilaginibacter hurinus TaxID=2201324 RepID=A0A367GUY3_9SPHI|nr:hypothetical protein [Mucilaginibacter hurinus]RCH56591.1 hypothetical protein DJ568_01660 [Mucilaginibacter hurinus]
MAGITAADKIIIFSRYIGQQVVINSLLNNEKDVTGTLQGIRNNALLIDVSGINRWIPLSDEITLCDIKLLLKPLKKLTAQIIDTANNLPVQAFITPYYQQLGFDMPVFIAPGHPCNCRYVHELHLADYRTAAEIDFSKQLITANI